ncbi:hypothetical protein ACQKCU_02205 [Heyndrickxia sporothermodurans]
MGSKHYAVILIVLLLFIVSSRSAMASWAYPFVVWDRYVYVVSDEVVIEIDKQIGRVTKYSDKEGNYGGNFSNVYKKGTKYYSIKGISTDIAIAVQEKDGHYKKATRGSKYKSGKDLLGVNHSNLLALIIGSAVSFVSAVICIYFVKIQARK